MQHDAGPAGAENDIHFASGRSDGGQVDHRLTHGLIDRVLPHCRLDETLIAFAAADAMAAGFLAIAIAGDDRDVEPHQRPDIAIGLAVGAQNFHHLPGRGD